MIFFSEKSFYALIVYDERFQSGLGCFSCGREYVCEDVAFAIGCREILNVNI